MEYIKQNLNEINKNIEIAAVKSGRKLSDITFIGVSKNVNTEIIQEAVNLGVSNLGENRVQEFTKKYPIIKGNPTWHMIGNLQTNKVKYIIDKVSLIHSCDSLKLAKEINNQAKKHNITMDVLIEINIASEETKHGIDPSNLEQFLQDITDLPYIMVKGLMTVAPYVENPEENRHYFSEMYKLLVDNNRKTVNNIDMQILSMGMTNDYMVAIEEGSNMVRIGTGLFGKRIY